LGWGSVDYEAGAICYAPAFTNYWCVLMLKTIILILLAGILVSLIMGFIFFFKDKGRSKRVLYALGVRVTLAVLLIGVVLYGLLSGELTMQAPWF
jgi:hypothetical protein